MTTAPEIWVRCGDVDPRGVPRNALKLSVGPGRDLSVDLGGIDERLNARVRPEHRDLIRLAAYVLAADSAVSRGRADDADLGDKWHRRFRFVVGVECLELFRSKEVGEELEAMLGLLSDDTFTFEFRQLRGTPEEKRKQLSLSGPGGRPMSNWDHIDEVMLFSGGLDSFAGAVDQVLTQRRNVILVSHNSGTKTWSTQRALADELRQRVRDDGRSGPDHVAIKMEKHKPALRVEQTQRTRSFLYAAFAGAVADLVGVNRIGVYENGVMALHVPKTAQLVGARGTRTAHPRVLSRMGRLLSLAGGKQVTLQNPFVLKTRTEVLSALGQTSAAPLIAQAVSCAHVARRRSDKSHCGVCSQCVDRRFSVLAAGLEGCDPAEGYEVDLETGAWPRDEDRLQLLAYLDSANRFEQCANPVDFLRQFGDVSRSLPEVAQALSLSQDLANQAIFELHKRHGLSVRQVIGAVLERNSRQLYEQRLPATSLPVIVTSQAPRTGAAVPAAETSATELRQHSQGWSCRFRGGPPFELSDDPGVSFLAAMLSAPGRLFAPASLLSFHFRDQASSNIDGLLEGMDAQTLSSLKEQMTALREELTAAEECDDQTAVEQLREDIGTLEPVLLAASSRRLRNKATDDQRDTEALVRRELQDALCLVASRSRAAAKQITDNLRIGYVSWFRASGIEWTVIPAALAPEPEASPGGAAPHEFALDIDLPRHSVRLRGRDISMRGAGGLQRRALFALAALARHAGKVLSSDRWASEMRSLGLQLKDGEGPDRVLVHRIRNAMSSACTGEVPSAELESVIETIRGRGYRLRLEPSEVRVVVSEASAVDVSLGRASGGTAPVSPAGPNESTASAGLR